MRRNSLVVYGLLAAFWLGILVWQLLEHGRLVRSLEDRLASRAHDIANSLAVVIRSQRRMGVVPRNRLETALQDLAQSSELLGIALLNPSGEVVAAGGQKIPDDLAAVPPGSFARIPGRWVTAALVELGPEPPPPGWGGDRAPPPEVTQKASSAVVWSPDDGGEPPPGDRPPERAAARQPAAGPDAHRPERSDGPPEPAEPPPPSPDAAGPLPPLPADGPEARSSPFPHWSRGRRSHPFFQSPEKYQALYEKQGLHMMLLMLNHEPTEALVRQDWLLRVVTVAVALAAAAGLALAWRNLTRSADLQVRLVRARATNTYLRELSLAAAGLAHETRNPLNLVRGITQMVASDPAVPGASREQLGAAIEEVDRITARLNEFIDYSKPREPRPQPVSPVAIARDVARTLQTDFEDKHIAFECADEPSMVMADPAMLRQVLFNLILNAVQAVPPRGHITVRVAPQAGRADLDVIDDGPGVPEHARSEIFRPYFSLSAKGSGLGLAVVRQIALAHGWDVGYAPNTPAGSVFRIGGMEATREPQA